MEDKDTIVLDFYESAYGPTIRIDVQSKEALNNIKNLLQQLVEADNSIDLTNINYISATEFDMIVLTALHNCAPGEGISLCKNDMEKIIVNWAMFPRSWKRIIGLVNGILEYGYPSHQYLTQEGVDDIIVELAFME